MVMVPSPSALSEDVSRSVISGVIYGSAMLHHVGAPVPQPIAPVTYMWRPVLNRDSDAMDHDGDGCNKPESIECSSSFRQLWVWIHVSALSEGFDSLKFACQKEMDERGCLVNCFSREGQLAKLEVLGSKAFQHLQKILHPVTCSSENSWQLKIHSAAVSDNDPQFKRSAVLENGEDFCTHAILSLRVKDPRIMPETGIVDVPESLSTGMLSVPEAEIKEHAALTGISDNKELLLSIWSKPEGKSTIYYDNELWNNGSGVSPPVEESVLCLEKHHLHMDNFCLDDPNSGVLNTSTKVQCSRSCPILLLKNNNQKGSLIGWSIILPLSWVRAFWVPLVSKEAHAIGLREKHWVACEMGLPFFPSDFPDCNAYTNFMATEAAAFSQKAERCPPDVRPWRVPIPPPWDTVRLAFNKGPARAGNGEIHSEEDMVDGNLLSNSDLENCSKSSFVHHGNQFDGLVARTYSVLIDFMRGIQSDRLLLFPQLPDRKTSIFKFMKDESMFGLSLNGIAQFSYDGKLCYLRILVHAYKEGVFEEGAVVCAPQLTDLSLMITRSGNDEGRLQMPQSAVRSYFKEQSSARWELHIPEDAVARESHRWPIGFVTTGFVRGSKKPVAEALCEAVLLARLREEQWKNMPRKRRKEIYVLVRNLRSSSYRLALATIVLEQEEDVEFM
ncbi:ribonucleases P/MRP protein subunit POP1-like isoform X3 [Alnus glutinosa]|nr:ribonucleases P/MRP protein subunit POP1-like isoform X3 [Alnus glutinosa]